MAADARRLEEVRLVALEDMCAAELEVGRHGHAIAELERLVTEHPLRERLWGLLMTGLYRAGRQADALGAFQRARQVLAEDLGIDPGPELCSLHTQVLAQDAALGPARPTFAVPHPLVAPSAALYGRTAELAVLRGAWHAAQTGERQSVQIRGPSAPGPVGWRRPWPSMSQARVPRWCTSAGRAGSRPEKSRPDRSWSSSTEWTAPRPRQTVLF